MHSSCKRKARALKQRAKRRRISTAICDFAARDPVCRFEQLAQVFGVVCSFLTTSDRFALAEVNRFTAGWCRDAPDLVDGRALRDAANCMADRRRSRLSKDQLRRLLDRPVARTPCADPFLASLCVSAAWRHWRHGLQLLNDFAAANGREGRLLKLKVKDLHSRRSLWFVRRGLKQLVTSLFGADPSRALSSAVQADWAYFVMFLQHEFPAEFRRAWRSRPSEFGLDPKAQIRMTLAVRSRTLHKTDYRTLLKKGSKEWLLRTN